MSFYIFSKSQKIKAQYCLNDTWKLTHFQKDVLLNIFIIKNYSPVVRCDLSLSISHSNNNLLVLCILKADKNEGN